MAPGARHITRIGRYVVLSRIAAGGMGTVYLARQLGAAGFARTVAIKFLHPHLAGLPEFVRRFLDEARLAARIVHPNVVTTIDVVEEGEDLFLVMEYVRGESLAALVRQLGEAGERVPVGIALRLVIDTLRGLHAAHTATTDDGAALQIVHRDVSPQNILVGLDGAAHLVDFGIAKAAGKLQTTAEGQLKGKLRYMAPEQIADRDATPRTDIYAASVVLWELLAGRKLFDAANDAAILAKVLEGAVLPPSHFRDLGAATKELDAIVLAGLDRDPERRLASADELAAVLESTGPVASSAEVAAWIDSLVGSTVRAREANIGEGTDASGVTATPTETAEPQVEIPTVVAAESVDTVIRRRRLPLFFVAGSLIGLAAVAAFAIPRLRSSPPMTANSPAPSPAVSESAPVPVTPEPASDPAPSAPTPPGPAPATSRATSPSPAGSAIKRRAKADCSSLYYKDPSGIRRVKRECL